LSKKNEGHRFPVPNMAVDGVIRRSRFSRGTRVESGDQIIGGVVLEVDDAPVGELMDARAVTGVEAKDVRMGLLAAEFRYPILDGGSS
jgi:hypothetical protein